MYARINNNQHIGSVQRLTYCNFITQMLLHDILLLTVPQCTVYSVPVFYNYVVFTHIHYNYCRPVAVAGRLFIK